MDDATRLNLVLAAVNAAGPADGDPNYAFKVADKAAQIMSMSQNGSLLADLLDQIENSKPFPAAILAVKKEARSTRGVVTFKAAKSKKADKVVEDAITKQPLAPGLEQARTDRTDGPMGKGLAVKLQSLIGYDVLLYIGHESFEKDGETLNMRRILHVEPIGRSKDPDAVRAYQERQLRTQGAAA